MTITILLCLRIHYTLSVLLRQVPVGTRLRRCPLLAVPFKSRCNKLQSLGQHPFIDAPAIHAQGPGSVCETTAGEIAVADMSICCRHNLRCLFNQIPNHSAVYWFRTPLALTKENSTITPIDRHNIELHVRPPMAANKLRRQRQLASTRLNKRPLAAEILKGRQPDEGAELLTDAIP